MSLGLTYAVWALATPGRPPYPDERFALTAMLAVPVLFLAGLRLLLRVFGAVDLVPGLHAAPLIQVPWSPSLLLAAGWPCGVLAALVLLRFSHRGGMAPGAVIGGLALLTLPPGALLSREGASLVVPLAALALTLHVFVGAAGALLEEEPR